MCQDKAVSYLNLIRYNPILLPRESFDPLAVLAGSRADLTWLGTLDDLVSSPSAAPQITRDDVASNVSDRRTSKLDAKVGVDLLGPLLTALGGGRAAKVSAGANKAGAVEIVLMNVLHDFVAPLRLGGFIAGAALREGVKDMLAPYEGVYLVTDTLKSDRFGLAAFDSAGASAQLSADAIKEVVDITARVEVTTASGNVRCYKGDRQLRFAFRALPLVFDPTTGRLSLGVDPGAMVSKFAPGEDPDLPLDSYELIAADQRLDINFG